MGGNRIPCVSEKGPDVNRPLPVKVLNHALLSWSSLTDVESWMSSMQRGFMVHSESWNIGEVLLLSKTAACQTTSFTSADFTQRQHGVWGGVCLFVLWLLFARRSVSSSAEWETLSVHFKIVSSLLSWKMASLGFIVSGWWFIQYHQLPVRY